MFDLPDAKRVRRSDLYAHDDNSTTSTCYSIDLEADAKLKARLEALYGDEVGAAGSGSWSKERVPASGVVGVGNQLNKADNEDDGEDGGRGRGQEFEFRLFSAPAMKSNLPGADDKMRDVLVQKIILDDEEEALGARSGFLNTRDPRVWIVRNAVGERKMGLESMAVSGDDILRGRENRNWGLEVPWRVRVLKILGRKRQKQDKTGTEENLIAVGGEDVENTKRKRPGKKWRLVLRKRKRKAEASKEAKKRETEARGEAEKEKRTRRNREKKVKRRMKEKAKKENAGAAGVDSKPVSTLNGDTAGFSGE